MLLRLPGQSYERRPCAPLTAECALLTRPACTPGERHLSIVNLLSQEGTPPLGLSAYQIRYVV